MTRERWEQIERIYLEAIQQPPRERGVFVSQQSGGDNSLVQDVESLLKAQEEAGGFMDTPAMQVAARAFSEAGSPAAAGQTVGPYQLLSRLGAGGMGEVWKAHDSRVGRDVAIKFCREQFTERFEQEVHAIAALNHPNICQLYDVGRNYLVMELVDGDRPSGPLPLETALGYARQIADALEAAHEKGVVHRDIKPDNIKIRPDGTVKVLDFGLAKLGAGTESESGAASIVAGTLAYMSPEQRRGRHIDKRTDIWSFGVLLYEMLTGECPFARPEANLDRVPAAVRRVLRGCLESDPKKRLRDIGDVWQLLEESPPPAPPRGFRWGWMTAALLAAIGAGALWLLDRPREPELKPLVRLEVDLGSDISMSLMGGEDPALSADGTRLAYVSQGHLYTRRLDEPEAVELTAAQGGTSPFFSPDGQWIAFFGHGKLRKISVNGGEAIDICRSNAAYAGGSWGDEMIVAALSSTGPLSQVPPAGGQPRAITELDLKSREASHRLPQILPGGKAVIFTAHTSITGFDEAKIDVISLMDHRRRTLVREATYGRYVPSGHLIYVSRGTLFAVRFDIDRLEVRGKAVRLLDRVLYSPQFGSASVSFSQGGTLIYRSGTTGTRLVTAQWLNSRGDTAPLFAKPGMYMDPRLSEDGKRLVIASGEGAGKGIWVYESLRGTSTRIVSGEGLFRSPLWTPDGRFIVYRSESGISWIRADGSGKPRLLFPSRHLDLLVPASFTANGRRLAIEIVPNGAGISGSDIATIPIENDGTSLKAGTPEPFIQTPFDEYHPSFSANGRWLAYTSDKSGIFQVYVRGFPDTRGEVMISTAGGRSPRFSHSGSELFFLNPASQLMAVRYNASGDSFQASRPRLWSENRLPDLGVSWGNYDPAPDGKRIAVLMLPNQPSQPGAGNHVVFLENFFDELRRRVPVGN